MVKTAKPFGSVSVDDKGNIRWNKESAPEVKVGKNVIIEKGVHIEIFLEEGAFVEIPDGTVLRTTRKLHLKKGEKIRL